LRLGFSTLLQAELQGFESDHAQRALDAQHQLVVQSIQVIEILGVGDQGVEDLAQFQQVRPILVGARQPRELAAEHETHLAEGDTRQELPETRARSRAAGRARSQVTLSLREPERLYWATYLANDRVLFLQINGTLDDPGMNPSRRFSSAPSKGSPPGSRPSPSWT
jgi:hypothetical protein